MLQTISPNPGKKKNATTFLEELCRLTPEPLESEMQANVCIIIYRYIIYIYIYIHCIHTLSLTTNDGKVFVRHNPTKEYPIKAALCRLSEFL